MFTVCDSWQDNSELQSFEDESEAGLVCAWLNHVWLMKHGVPTYSSYGMLGPMRFWVSPAASTRDFASTSDHLIDGADTSGSA